MDLLLEDDILKSIYDHLKNGAKPSDLLENLTHMWINFPSLLNEFGGLLHDHASGVEPIENSESSLNLTNIFTLEEEHRGEAVAVESPYPLSFSHEFFLSAFSQQISSRCTNASINDEKLHIDTFFLQNGPSSGFSEAFFNDGPIIARMLSKVTSKLDQQPFLYIDMLTESVIENAKCSQKLQHESPECSPKLTNGISECLSDAPYGCEHFLQMLLACVKDGFTFEAHWAETLLALLGRPIKLERFILMLVLVFHQDAHLKVGGALLHSLLSLVASMDAELLRIYLRFRLPTSARLLDGIMSLLTMSPFSKEALLQPGSAAKDQLAVNSAFSLHTLTRPSEWLVDSIFWLILCNDRHSFEKGLSLPLGISLGHCCHYASWILSPGDRLMEFPTLSRDLLYKVWSTPILPFFVIELLRSSWPNNGPTSTDTIGVRYEFLSVLMDYFPSMETPIPKKSLLNSKRSKDSSLSSLPIEILEQLLMSIPIATDMELIVLFCWLNHRIGHPLISSVTSELVLLEGKIGVFIVELAICHGPAVALPVLLFLFIHLERFFNGNISRGHQGAVYEASLHTQSDQPFVHVPNSRSLSSALTLQLERELFSSLIFVDYLVGTIDELKCQTYPRITKLLRASCCGLSHVEQSEMIRQIYSGYELTKAPLVQGERPCGGDQISAHAVDSEPQLTWLASALLFHA
ncbi:hypothetical protein DI09_6p80 [Mitosporidium daphniae]|uniref:Uncharacterized protein n=1 Tax=Mitosporidium daphniae TaxID=1485682 RepID=A0A098VNS4_9MICR|nr:uncharacterized protein DI09_86p40 [Mitosporidium daphniae]XP_013236911.1 uncharacterized protein DI09_6p80 [Mitosporidium daphniae]KGG50140.1 hypothetical protein DI09_86p40 [Mitosporidium daphniae]KGG50424.1 hypothetical protein DI09_6p80 [Mitosporidium daphniae]|eukprot:XP_013236580.1 uncharacterized protein DI09_86p40 [Mitosporidium daphniae]